MHVLLLALLLVQSAPLDQYLAAQKAFAADPKSEEKAVVLATILFQQGQIERAVEFLEPFVKDNARAGRAKILLALGYVREEKYQQARGMAAETAAESPAEPNAHHVLGLSLAGLNELDAAEGSFKRAIELKPDFADAYFQLGLVYARKPDTQQQARSAFQRAVQLGDTQPELLRNLASVNVKLGDYTEAIRQLQMLLKRNPESAEAYFLLADAQRKSGATDEAAESLKQFQKLSASAADRRSAAANSQGFYEEGMMLLFGPSGEFLVPNFDRAYAAFRKAVEAVPQLDAAYYRMAQISFLRNDRADALDKIRHALNLNSVEPEYYFVLASCLKDVDVHAAIEAANRAITLKRDTADFHNLLGILLEKSGDLAHAVESYQHAVDLDSGNENFRANLASVQRRVQGRP